MSDYAVHKRVESQIPDSGNSICIVLEYPTTTESRLNKINTGGIQQVLNPMCTLAGIDAQTVMITHAFQLKPAQENAQFFFHKRNEYKAIKKEGEWQSNYSPSQYGFLKQDYEQDINRLYKEINDFNPNIIITMGGLGLWALTSIDKVGSYRGALTYSNKTKLNRPYKIMPTYSPFAVLKNYSFRPTVVSDLKKAMQESTTADIVNTEREIYIEPTYEEVKTFFKECREENNEDNPLSFDIETASGEITCIGFAPSPKRSMVVPFRDITKKSQTFYDYHTELAVWKEVADLLQDKTIVKVAQNQTYDVSWLNHKYGIEVAGTVHDTMHAQHSLQPEMEKGLGFLGSIYTNEGAWKNLTSFSKSTKAEE
jgi:hypothetical protein|tara:strand:- start:217 stop:1320 length:1104 start_codon:yes stop_codon:yes gene_type:complete